MGASKRAAATTTRNYLALLRGINVGGNNIIPMKALAATFAAVGLAGVRTFIQSGNVLFEADGEDPRRLERRIEAALTKAYRYDARVVVRTSDQMAELARGFPRSWRHPDPAWKHNVLFLRHDIDSPAVLEGVRPKPDIEEVTYQPGVLLWSAAIATLGRTTMLKVASMPIYQSMTVRSLTTTQKLCDLLTGRDVSRSSGGDAAGRRRASRAARA